MTQTPGSVDPGLNRPPVLVLGLGNRLLTDDGFGLDLLEELEREAEGCWGNHVEFVDGGTQGLMLLKDISQRPAVLILDAVDRGGNPGAVHVLRAEEVWGTRFSKSTTAHEGNAGELLAAAQLLGECPEQVAVVGAQPQKVATGIGLTEIARSALRPALLHAKSIVSEFVARYV